MCILFHCVLNGYPWLTVTVNHLKIMKNLDLADLPEQTLQHFSYFYREHHVSEKIKLSNYELRQNTTVNHG